MISLFTYPKFCWYATGTTHIFHLGLIKLYLRLDTRSFVYFYTQAQAKLGHLRVEANRIKSGLERKIQVHKTAVKRAKTILKHMQVSTINGAINFVPTG